MTQKQRLIYSILIAVSVLVIMLGLSWLQNAGKIDEKTFQYIAIGVAVVDDGRIVHRAYAEELETDFRQPLQVRLEWGWGPWGAARDVPPPSWPTPLNRWRPASRTPTRTRALRW